MRNIIIRLSNGRIAWFLLILVASVIGLCLLISFISASRRNIDYGAYEQLREGFHEQMTSAEVEKLLGGPQGDYSFPPLWIRRYWNPGGDTDYCEFIGWGSSEQDMKATRSECWKAWSCSITIGYGENDRVVHLSYSGTKLQIDKRVNLAKSLP